MLNSGLVSWRLLHSLESRNPVKHPNRQRFSTGNAAWRRFLVQSLMQYSISSSLLLLLMISPLSAQETSAQIEAAAIGAELDAEQKAEQGKLRELEISKELKQRQQAINDLQSDQGIYATQLQEAYGDLAALYEELQDFDSAITIYSDALQISRINSGLYSDQQLPIIQSLIDSNSQLRNWEETDDLHELSYHISSRLYAPGERSYLQAAEYYGDWKLRLLRENLLDQNYRAYARAAEDLSNFYDRIINNLDVQPELKPESLLQILYARTETDLVLARAIASTPYTAFEGTASRTITRSRCRNVRNASGQVVRECVNVQVENPRYRQSQRDAKQFAINRRTRAVQESIDRLRQIYTQSNDLGSAERDQLESQIAELETQNSLIARQSRSRHLF